MYVSDVIIIVGGNVQLSKEGDPNANSVNQFSLGEWINDNNILGKQMRIDGDVSLVYKVTGIKIMRG